VLTAALALIASRDQDSLAADGTIYVDARCGGREQRTSWTDAFTTLQPALDGRDWGPDLGGGRDLYPYPGILTRRPAFGDLPTEEGVALYGGFDRPWVTSTGRTVIG